jgi:NAD(P)H-flavin reductase
MTKPAPVPDAHAATPPGADATHVAPQDDPLCPFPAVVRSIAPEIPGVCTFRIEFEDGERQERYRIEPGQFNMLYLPGIGEVPISVSSAPDEGPGIGHTIRFVGRVTRAMEALRPDFGIGMRGPYGSSWPLHQIRGWDVVLVAGGLGLAPLRLVVKALLADRDHYGRLVLLYGARQPADLLFAAEYPDWERQGLELSITVDRADAAWHGNVGVVPILLRRLRIDPERTVLLACGPEIMMRLSVAEALADRFCERNIYVSLERNMQCAVGLCGHCQLGPDFVCKDGPVFTYSKVARFLNQGNF